MALDELLAKQVPYSIEAEQAVLGSMLIDPKHIPDVMEVLKQEDFYLENNRILYEAMQKMFLESRNVDPVTVLDEVKLMGYRDELPRDYVLQLVETTPHSANLMDYAKIVRGKSMLRELQQVGTDIVELTRSEEDEADTVPIWPNRRFMPSARAVRSRALPL